MFTCLLNYKIEARVVRESLAALAGSEHSHRECFIEVCGFYLVDFDGYISMAMVYCNLYVESSRNCGGWLWIPTVCMIGVRYADPVIDFVSRLDADREIN